jgi:hypothetical protein
MYEKIKYWHENYGFAGIEDKRAVENFFECETREIVTSLRTELAQVAAGNYNPDSLRKLIGKGRENVYHTYQEWAKMMLQWMAGADKH